MTEKPRMFIAEDSKTLLDAYVDKFSERFEVVRSRGGRKAFALVEESKPFDICIVDLIMPVEAKKFGMEDAEETGVRLIKHIVEKGKSQRIIVMTVRWDVEKDVEEVIDQKTRYKFLLKQRCRAGDLGNEVNKLMKR